MRTLLQPMGSPSSHAVYPQVWKLTSQSLLVTPSKYNHKESTMLRQISTNLLTKHWSMMRRAHRNNRFFQPYHFTKSGMWHKARIFQFKMLLKLQRWVNLYLEVVKGIRPHPLSSLINFKVQITHQVAAIMVPCPFKIWRSFTLVQEKALQSL